MGGRIPPTGKRVAWAGMSTYRLLERRILEKRIEEYLLGLRSELGPLVGGSAEQR